MTADTFDGRNGEFQMTTSDSTNLQVKNGQLYIIPTLTSQGTDTSMPFSVPDCNVNDPDAAVEQGTASCAANSTADIPPVRSARLSTKNKKGIRFGKIEVRAKLPRGDWLWPAIWMLPQNDSVYGTWPLGGEIDVSSHAVHDVNGPETEHFLRRSWNRVETPSRMPHRVSTSSAQRSTMALY